MDKLISIFKENWKTISLSYILVSINATLVFIYPKVLGDTIDKLVVKDYTYIWHLVAIFIGFVVFGYISRVYDVKVFSSIYRKFASKEIENQINKGIDNSKINGRLTLMNSVIHFFEQDIATIMQTILGLIISVYFISNVSGIIVLGLIISGAITIAVSYYFSPKISKITCEKNNLSEEQTDVIYSMKMNFINNLLMRKQKLDVKAMRINAKYFIFIDMIAYISITILLAYYVMFNKVTIGSVFSTYRYMFDFANSVIGLTYIIPSFINIKDVINRLKNE